MSKEMSDPSPALMFWTKQGFGASSLLIVDEGNLSYTNPADASHVPAWQRIFDSRSLLQPAQAELDPAAVNRDAHMELRLLVESTRLPVEDLGELLGASRRTMYNWLAGRSIRDEAQSRIFRLCDAIAPLARSRDPMLVRAWLLRGDPSPASLVADERWDEFDARVREETKPLRSLDDVAHYEGGEPRGDPPDILRAALIAFSTAPVRTLPPRTEWTPRELTGIGSEDEEEAE